MIKTVKHRHDHDASKPIDHLLDHFQRQYGDCQDVHMALAPGRVNLLGDHTDYNDGFVLPMTIDRAVYWALGRRNDATVHLYSINYDESLTYSLRERPDVPPSGWSSYVTGVIEELRQRQLIKSGFEGVIFGDVPLGGGLSSSAALEVATAVALQELLKFTFDPVAMVKLCQQVEHRYAGVQCGIMDQFASRLGRENHALLLDCRTLDYNNIPLPLDEVSVVIVNSGVKRALAGSNYNERRAECQQGVDFFHQFDSSITALRDVTSELLEKHRHALPENVYRRCQHVITENQRVRNAAKLLKENQLVTFGTLMNESHASLKDLYEVSCPELDALVEISQQTEGVLGARMTGAGFGGCTVHLVKKTAVPALQERIQQLYPQRFELKATIFVLEKNFEARSALLK